jgi:plasmid stability protein
MAQLVVRNLEEAVVRKLKQKAAKDGVSMEEEHRRILRSSLMKKSKPKMSFLDFLCTMPNVGDDADFARPREIPRKEVNLED